MSTPFSEPVSYHTSSCYGLRPPAACIFLQRVMVQVTLSAVRQPQARRAAVCLQHRLDRTLTSSHRSSLNHCLHQIRFAEVAEDVSKAFHCGGVGNRTADGCCGLDCWDLKQCLSGSGQPLSSSARPGEAERPLASLSIRQVGFRV